MTLVPSFVVTCFGKVVEFTCTLDGSNEYWSVSSTCGRQNYTNMSSFNQPLSSVNNITIISFKNDSMGQVTSKLLIVIYCDTLVECSDSATESTEGNKSQVIVRVTGNV